MGAAPAVSSGTGAMLQRTARKAEHLQLLSCLQLQAHSGGAPAAMHINLACYPKWADLCGGAGEEACGGAGFGHHVRCSGPLQGAL